MSGCLECGRPTQKGRCRICRVEHGAPQMSTDDGECPECGRDQLTNRVCNDCERVEDIVGDLDQHDDDLADARGEGSD